MHSAKVFLFKVGVQIYTHIHTNTYAYIHRYIHIHTYNICWCVLMGIADRQNLCFSKQSSNCGHTQPSLFHYTILCKKNQEIKYIFAYTLYMNVHINFILTHMRIHTYD